MQLLLVLTADSLKQKKIHQIIKNKKLTGVANKEKAEGKLKKKKICSWKSPFNFLPRESNVIHRCRDFALTLKSYKLNAFLQMVKKVWLDINRNENHVTMMKATFIVQE